MADVVAGLVLGALPLALKAIENYEQALRPLTDYFHYKSTIRTMKRELIVQQEQLKATLRCLGLEDPSSDEVSQRLQEVYPNAHTEFTEILSHMDGLMVDLLDKLLIDMEGKPKWHSGNSRISWEWRRVRRSFKRKDRQQLFEDLDKWNTRLKNCFESKREIPTGEDDPTASHLIGLFDQKSCDSCRRNIQNLHEALTQAWSRGCADTHQSSINLIWHQKGHGFATVDKLSLGFPSSSKRWRDVTVQVQLADIVAEKLSPVLAPLEARQTRGTKLLGNDRKRGPKVKAMAPVKTLPQKTTSLVQIMTHPILTESLCVMASQKKWSGFLPNTDSMVATRFLLMADNVTSPDLVPVPLRSLLHASSLQTPPFPVNLSRRDRFSVAAAVCWAVLYLGGTPWLDTTWTEKDDIQLLFNQLMSNSAPPTARYPSISHTFRSTLPKPKFKDEERDFSGIQIRHKTLFALGTLLIELCLNSSFANLRKRVRGSSPSTGTEANTHLNDFEIAQGLNDEVYLDAGDAYGYAVQRCLRCEFPGRDVTKDFDHGSFRKQFYIGVVAPVQGTFEQQMITS